MTRFQKGGSNASTYVESLSPKICTNNLSRYSDQTKQFNDVQLTHSPSYISAGGGVVNSFTNLQKSQEQLRSGNQNLRDTNTTLLNNFEN